MAIHHLYIHGHLFLGSADGLENPIQQLGLDENRKGGNPKGTQKLNLWWYQQKLFEKLILQAF